MFRVWAWPDAAASLAALTPPHPPHPDTGALLRAEPAPPCPPFHPSLSPGTAPRSRVSTVALQPAWGVSGQEALPSGGLAPALQLQLQQELLHLHANQLSSPPSGTEPAQAGPERPRNPAVAPEAAKFMQLAELGMSRHTSLRSPRASSSARSWGLWTTAGTPRADPRRLHSAWLAWP